jgi:hypothetical protein
MVADMEVLRARLVDAEAKLEEKRSALIQFNDDIKVSQASNAPYL